MIGSVCKDKNKEGVERNDPKNVFEEDERSVQTEHSFPSQLFQVPLLSWLHILCLNLILLVAYKFQRLFIVYLIREALSGLMV